MKLSISFALACIALPMLGATADASVDGLGQLTQSVAIDVPEYRGLEPAVALSYASGAGNGFVGVGWALEVGVTIEKVSATFGIPRGDATDVFLLGGEELRPCVAASRSPSCTTAIDAYGSSDGFFSTEIESYQRIRRDVAVDGWTVWEPDGTQIVMRAFDGGAIYRVTTVSDTHGNTVDYHYWCDGQSACYPDEITYAGTGAAPGARIKFYREARSDEMHAGRGAGFQYLAYRLRSVAVFMDGQLARAYRLSYAQSLANGRSILSSIQQFGSDAVLIETGTGAGLVSAGPTPALPAITLTTPSMQAGNSVANQWLTFSGLTNIFPAPTWYPARFESLMVGYHPAWHGSPEGELVPMPYGDAVGDFDGDGRADWLNWSVTTNGCGHIETRTILSTKTGHGEVIDAEVLVSGTGGSCDVAVWPADLDGDRRDDLLVFRSGTLIKLIARDDGTFAVDAVREPWPHPVDHCTLGDFDGDARLDLACTSGTTLHVARSLAIGWQLSSDALTGLGVAPGNGHEIVAGDFNADGLGDMTIATQAGSGWTLLAGRSNGAGGFDWTSQSASGWTHGSASERHRLTGGDFDGDGKNDVMLVRTMPGADAVYIGLAAKGATARYRLSQVASAPWLDAATTGDFDGDGRTDLLLTDRQVWARGLGDGQFAAPPTWIGSLPDCDIDPDLYGKAALVSAADLNGDGRSDVLCTFDSTMDEAFLLNDRMTTDPLRDTHRWIQADISGDGIAELVYVASRDPGYRIDVVSTLNQQRTSFDVLPSATVPGLDEPDTSRFLAMDVGRAGGGGPDGKADLVLVDSDGGTLRTYAFLSAGDGTFTTVVDAPWGADYEPHDLQHWVPAQLDNDGQGDLVHLSRLGDFVRVDTLRALGDGTWESDSEEYLGQTPASALRSVQDFLVVDVSGDGVSDLVHVEANTIRTLLGDGDGDFSERFYASPTPLRRDMRRIRVADLNGDGLGDLVHVSSSGPAYASQLELDAHLSDGRGGWYRQNANLVHVAPQDEESSLLEDANLARFLDVDGDRLTDLVHLSSYLDAAGQHRSALVVARNPGPDMPATWPSVLTKNLNFASYDRDPWRWQSYVDPDTLDAGLLYVHPMQSQVYLFHHSRDRISRIVNGTGGATVVSYSPLPGHRTYLPEGSLPVVVTSLERRDEVSSPVISETESYGYGQARYSFARRRMLGFSWTSQRDHDSFTLIESTLDDHCGARPAAVKEMDLAATIFSYRTFGYVDTGTAAPYTCDTYARYDYECEGTPSCRLARTEVLGIGDYGTALTTLTTVAEGRTSLVVRPPLPSAVPYIIHRPVYEAVYDHDGTAWTTRAFSRFSYDGRPPEDGPGAHGELTRVDAFDNVSGGFQSTTYEYDWQGELVATTDPAGQVATITYDARYGLYPATICAGSSCQVETVDFVTGEITSTLDDHGAVTTHAYDAHGRRTRTQYADASFTTTAYLAFGVISGPLAQRQRIRTERSDGSVGDGVLWVEALVDGLGRVYRTEREGGATQETRYIDASDRPEAVSLVHDIGSPASEWTIYRYDAVGRTIATERPDGSHPHTQFLVGQTVGIDALGHRRTAFTDGRGRVIRIDELDQGVVATTRYHYDGVGQLTSIVDALGHTTTIAYDTLGRRTAITDPDRGTTRVTYLGNGLTEEVTDARGQRIRFDYDGEGHRILREDLDDQGNLVRTVRWSWELGRIIEMRDNQPNAELRNSYGYDALGRVAESTLCTDGRCVDLHSSYDLAGRLRRLIYPDGESVDYAYDTAGRLESVGGFVTAMTYDVNDQLLTQTFGNGVVTRFTYDPLRHWTDTVTAKSPSEGVIYAAEYVHDRAGNIVAVDDDVDLQYEYDDLGRLRRVDSADPAHREEYAYDAIGRMRWTARLGDIRYDDPGHVHAPTQADVGHTRRYDLLGNLTMLRDPSGRRLELSWTVDGRLASITDGDGETTQFAYDAGGARVKKSGPAGESLYFGPLVEQRDGESIFFYKAGDRLIARREAGALSYYTQDQTRSTRVETDEAGSVVNRYDHAAFGRTLASVENTPQDHEFGGGRHDDESGLTYMNARYYDSELGHFVSADTLVPDLLDPQSLHRYSYAQQDPINFWDPSGHMRASVERKKELEAQAIPWGSMYLASCAGFGNFAVSACGADSVGLFTGRDYAATTKALSEANTEDRRPTAKTTAAAVLNVQVAAEKIGDTTEDMISWIKHVRTYTDTKDESGREVPWSSDEDREKQEASDSDVYWTEFQIRWADRVADVLKIVLLVIAPEMLSFEALGAEATLGHSAKLLAENELLGLRLGEGLIGRKLGHWEEAAAKVGHDAHLGHGLFGRHGPTNKPKTLRLWSDK